MVGKKKSLFIQSLLIIGFFGCGETQDSTSEINSLTPQELNQMLHDAADVSVIDVRTEEEYNGKLGHIKESFLLPLQNIEDWIGNFNEDEDKRIIMVCRSGNRSGVATKYFADNGFTQVYNLTGGMLAWNEAKFPVEKDTDQKNINKDAENK